MAVGKTSAAKEATVWVEITPDKRLIVNYGNENIADLPSIEPELGDIDAINEELDYLGQAETTERTHFAMGLETIKRFTKVRSKSPCMDLMFTDIGNTTYVKIGDRFIGAFESIDRPSVEDRSLLFDNQEETYASNQNP